MHAGARRVLRRALVGPRSAVSIAAALAAAALVWSAAGGCSSASGPQLARDEMLRQKIVGSWAEGVSPYGVATFLPGGIYRGVIYLSAEQPVALMAVEGWWRIDGGRLYSKGETIEMLQPLPILADPYRLYVDVIVDISDDTMRLIDEEGTEHESKRVHGRGETL